MNVLDRVFPPDQCDPDLDARWWTAANTAAALLEVTRPDPTPPNAYRWRP